MLPSRLQDDAVEQYSFQGSVLLRLLLVRSCFNCMPAKKSLPIFDIHWLGLSILIVILARGHGSGRVDKQCKNSDVSSGGTAGNSCGRGSIYRAVFGCCAFTTVACSLAAA